MSAGVDGGVSDFKSLSDVAAKALSKHRCGFSLCGSLRRKSKSTKSKAGENDQYRRITF